ncbi:fasciclin domain-containing protein [Alteriqipengyuania lutimaris]|uniref:Fasciclin domain-containing protein n=1 Tax=Alteriqipengyuania lutimaris TaxID=1538146 RepID=A0A395LKX0_9SPHN|nr:fasciclin domain-containing protein [Alteriqipengyuania lutimaris]MBB3033284.1 putative surface protein with fasciclin (FAS1) repeats [Alteriqipengyuania lutimaris]RDS77676.1 fasciclin domain-containing protein [Alteriqipengyuania lutimaris]
MRIAAFATAIVAASALSACAPSLADDVDLADVAPDDIAFVGDSPIYPNATIAENIAAADAFSHLAMLVERVGLAETLGAAGPYTIFAPTDAAFDEVPQALREGLGRPENADRLKATVAGHAIPGTITSADLAARIVAGGGRWEAQTLAGSTLTFRQDGDSLRISVDNGTGVRVTMADLAQANGMMHVIDGVLLPEG